MLFVFRIFLSYKDADWEFGSISVTWDFPVTQHIVLRLFEITLSYGPGVIFVMSTFSRSMLGFCAPLGYAPVVDLGVSLAVGLWLVLDARFRPGQG